MNYLQSLSLSITPQGRAIVAKEAKHQQEVLQLMNVLPGSYRYEQVEAAITASGLSSRLLYEHASAGLYTREMARLDEALGLPVKEVTSLGGYWQDCLAGIAKLQYGKSLVAVGDELERVVEAYNAAGFSLSKEELAHTIVLLCDTPLNREKAITDMHRLVDEATQTLPEPEKPAKKPVKTPYYSKQKGQWWK